MKTTKLSGDALDWAVARALGIPSEELRLPRYPGEGLCRYMRDEDGTLDVASKLGEEVDIPECLVQ